MSAEVYEKCTTSPAPGDGARSYKSRDFPLKMSSNLLQLRRDGRFCDIDLVSGETIVKAHRAVLAASCAYFDAMFSVGLQESQKDHVSLPSVPPDILPILIDFIYTGEVVIDKNIVQHLLIAADMLQLRDLVNGCGEFLRKELHASNCLGMYRFAEAHNCTRLADKALAHAQSNWHTVAAGDEILELPLPQLLTLLSSEQLCVDSESQVLYPALRWLEHEPATRRRHCFEVLNCVRLALIPPLVLDDALVAVRDPSICVALKTVRKDMKSGRGALVSLGAEPRARARRVLFVVGGGWLDDAEPPSSLTNQRDRIFASVVKFDMHSRKWAEVAPMRIARIQPGVAVLGGLVYAVGGEQGSQILANGEVYDPKLDSWRDIKPMDKARSEFGLAACGGALYALGGWVGCDMGLTVERYDDVQDCWETVGQMPEPRFGMGIVTYQGLIYMVGGCTHTRRHTRDVLAFQPGGRAWRRLAPMRAARSQAAAVVLDHHLYVIGGNAPRRTTLSSVERYSFDDDSWEEMPPLREARAGCMAGAAGGVLLAAGGESGGVQPSLGFYRARRSLATAEMLDTRAPAAAWEPAPPLPHCRAEGGAALL